jgi:polar amino acid transport system substrate-binding protein
MRTLQRSRASTTCLGFFFVLLFLATGIATADAQKEPDPRIVDLVQAGQLRVGLFPPEYIEGDAGELRSVWVDFARALAAHMGVQLVLQERPTRLKVEECLWTGACDVIFMPFDDRMPEVGEFSTPFMQVDYTLLAPAGSPIHSVAEADRAGVRIAAVRTHGSTIALSRILNQAELEFRDTPEATFDLLRSGRADLMASTRYTLQRLAAQLPGARLLDGEYGHNFSHVVVRNGQAPRLAYINEFIAQATKSGLLQQIIDRAGPPRVTGLVVAAPAAPE